MTRDKLWDMMNTEDVAMFIDRLAERWEEEKDCENINDYKKPIEDKLGINIFKMEKRPFGFTAICDEDHVLSTIKIKFYSDGTFTFTERAQRY